MNYFQQYSTSTTSCSCNERKWISSNKPFVPTIDTLYTIENEYNFTDLVCGKMLYICWPTTAPSRLHLYASGGILDRNNTFPITTLKIHKIFYIILNEDGKTLAKEFDNLFRSKNHYRDLAFDSDWKTIYVITDTVDLLKPLMNE